jgi:hypothetical protein
LEGEKTVSDIVHITLYNLYIYGNRFFSRGLKKSYKWNISSLGRNTLLLGFRIGVGVGVVFGILFYCKCFDDH